MKSFFTVLISFLSFFQVKGQEPTIIYLKTYGGNISAEVSSNVTKTNDGGFIICITSNSTSGPIDTLCDVGYSRRAIFQKYNADASVLEWSKCFKSDWTDTGFIYMFFTNAGNYLLAGENNSGGQWLFRKEDVIGNLIWTKVYGGTGSRIMRGMISTDNGSYIVTGEVFYIDTNFVEHHGDVLNADIGILKIDSLGNKVWGKVIGGTGDEHVWAIVNAPNSGCYIVGTTPSDDYDCSGNHGSGSGTIDAYLARLDSNGNLLWHKDLGGTGNDQGNYGFPNGKGGIIVGATSESNDGDVTHQISGNGFNMWALEVDSNGNIEWNNSYGGGGGEFTNSICKATDGSIWIAGTNQISDGVEVQGYYGGTYDAWFVHTDSIGNFINAKVLGSHKQDEGYMIYPLINNNVIAGGYYDTAGGTFSDIFFGGEDAFITIFSPQTTDTRQITKSNNRVEIYPNPARSNVNIKVQQDNIYSVIITDILGREVYCKSKNINDPYLIVSTINWQKGIYCIQVINDDGYKTVQKLLIQ